MCGLVVSALVLSLIGAGCQLALGRGLRVPTRLVLGFGPRLGARDAPPRPVELRLIVLWAWAALEPGGSPAARAAVRALGPIAILFVPFAVSVTAVMFAGIAEEVPAARLVVDDVTPGSPAEQAGIQSGDVVLTAAGTPVRTTVELRDAITGRAGHPTPLVLDRRGTRVELDVTPEDHEGVARIGVTPVVTLRTRSVGPLEAIAVSTRLVASTIEALTGTVSQPSTERITGPVGMVRDVRDRADAPRAAQLVAVLAAAWTVIALLWSTIAAITELAGALRTARRDG